MSQRAKPLPEGSLVYDCWAPLSRETLKALKDSSTLPAAFGRYAENLVPYEVQGILEIGCGYFLIHGARAPGKWTPSTALGVTDGAYLTFCTKYLRTPVNTWAAIDYETPSAGTTPGQETAYLNAAFGRIFPSGLEPALYEGYGNGLPSAELYSALTCKAYWKSVSNVAPVAKRGYALTQERPNVSLCGHLFDISHAHVDALGGQVWAGYLE